MTLPKKRTRRFGRWAKLYACINISLISFKALEAAFSAEDLDILDIDCLRWDGEYKLRADEVDEMTTILDALSLNKRQGILVLGPSYALEAQKLRKHVDWMVSDDEPIDKTGAVCVG